MQQTPPTMMDPSAGNPDGGMPGADPGNGFGVDFIPECSDETAHALMPSGVCSYPLPDGVDVSVDVARVALLTNGSFTMAERVDGPFACNLVSGGFYFDSLSMPTRITLCPQSCLSAGGAAEMQVVLVLGCPAP
jgi:hypothetical protein